MAEWLKIREGDIFTCAPASAVCEHESNPINIRPVVVEIRGGKCAALDCSVADNGECDRVLKRPSATHQV